MMEAYISSFCVFDVLQQFQKPILVDPSTRPIFCICQHVHVAHASQKTCAILLVINN